MQHRKGLSTTWRTLLLSLLSLGLFVIPAAGGTLYQVATIDALLDGVYEGSVSIQELTRRGTAGIGTFHALDGEMILSQGICYRAAVTGEVSQVPPEETTPFASVASWGEEEEQHYPLSGVASLEDLEHQVAEKISNINVPWLVLVKGTFEHLRYRSVPPQQEPYPPLAEAAKEQQFFTSENTPGELVGFWAPSYVEGINVPGFHLHFLSEDRTKGGHLTECTAGELELVLVPLYEYTISLPASEAFRQADLRKNRSEALSEVERPKAPAEITE